MHQSLMEMWALLYVLNGVHINLHVTAHAFLPAQYTTTPLTFSKKDLALLLLLPLLQGAQMVNDD
jgi:hypothetical protein